MPINYSIYILSALLFIGLIAIGFGFLVLMGNLLAMKILAKNGYALFSKNIKKDYKLLKNITDEGVGWLHIPGVVYAPIMNYCNGKYKTKNLFGKDNLYGEIRLLNTESTKHLSLMGIQEDLEIKDLSIIEGSTKGKIGSLRHSNFSEIMKVKEYIDTKETIKIFDEHKLREFEVAAVNDMSLGEKHTVNIKTRSDFINYIYLNSKYKSEKDINLNKKTLLLQCRSKIDTIMVLLIEK